MDGLAALVREQIGADPYAGTVYVFRSDLAHNPPPRQGRFGD
jgi:hypothetical protein